MHAKIYLADVCGGSKVFVQGPIPGHFGDINLVIATEHEVADHPKVLGTLSVEEEASRGTWLPDNNSREWTTPHIDTFDIIEGLSMMIKEYVAEDEH